VAEVGLEVLHGLQHVPHRGDPARYRQARGSRHRVQRAGRELRRQRPADGRAGLAVRGTGLIINATPQGTKMDFEYSAKTKELQAKLLKFMDDYIYPAEVDYHHELEANTKAGKRWSALQTIEKLKPKARAAGLWNLFLPVDSSSASGYEGAGLTNQEYAPLAEIMGRVMWSSEVFNCSAPDTGNMETIARYGSDEIKARWLKPLLEGEIRSAFAMTEPEVASSDATNICTRIERSGDDYVINGHKWWTSGAMDPRCAVFITMGKTDPQAPRHSQQSMVIVPANTKGIRIARPLTVFGYDDAPH